MATTIDVTVEGVTTTYTFDQTLGNKDQQYAEFLSLLNVLATQVGVLPTQENVVPGQYNLGGVLVTVNAFGLITNILD